MKTPEPPRSSRGKGKAEERAPKGKTPMARFQSVAKAVVGADPQVVREMEAKARKPRGD